MVNSRACGAYFFVCFNDTATTEIYTLSLHDALPIFCAPALLDKPRAAAVRKALRDCSPIALRDRKRTRMNSSHITKSYAVFCLKKKKTKNLMTQRKKTKKTLRQQSTTKRSQ